MQAGSGSQSYKHRNSQSKSRNGNKRSRSSTSAGHARIIMPFRISTRAVLLAIISLLALTFFFVWRNNQDRNSTVPRSFKKVDWNFRRDEVKDAFVTSWKAYKKYAWGFDRFHPVSKSGSQMSPDGLGWIIVDGLDTMMIMNMTEELPAVRKWISRKLTYDQHQDVNTFEITIRMLGGLLSAHYLSTILPHASSQRDYIYLNKSIDLADRLLGAYNSRSGIPYASIWLDSGAGIVSHADGGSSSTAEASTTQLEMKYLAHLTGNEKYWRKAENVIKVLDENDAQDGLLPIFVHPDSGVFTSRQIRLGSRGDSYYEYLVKQYLQTSETIYLDMWEQALAGIQKHMITSTSAAKLQFVAELPHGIGSKLYPKMDHLVCFLPGSIALGVTGGLAVAEAERLPTWNKDKEHQLHLAKELTKTCFGMYAVTATGLAPEIAFFNADEVDLAPGPRRPSTRSGNNRKEDWKKDFVVKPLDAHNLQRPETVESLLLMYRITEDPLYRQWGWEIFQAFQRHGLLEDGEGFTSLNDVNAIPPPRRDNMESFWLAETLKYLYLLFSPSDFLPLTEVVFNTEAHILPRLKDPFFKTGWSRKHYFSTKQPPTNK